MAKTITVPEVKVPRWTKRLAKFALLVLLIMTVPHYNVLGNLITWVSPVWWLVLGLTTLVLVLLFRKLPAASEQPAAPSDEPAPPAS